MGKGHAEKGAVVAGVIARRFGMTDAEAELTEFLVRQHLTMSHLSQRRDLADPDVVARFAEKVGDEARLIALYLLTLCDTAMTAPNNLSAWKDELLRDLVLRTRARFGGRPVEARGHDTRAKVMQLADDPAATAVVDAFDPRLFTQLTPRQAARHARLLAGARDRVPPVALEVHCYPMKGHSELALVAPDAPGVLAAIAGALAAHRVDVLGAVLGRVEVDAGARRRRVLRPRPQGRGDRRRRRERWSRLLADLRELLAGPGDTGGVAKLMARRRPPSGLPPRVTPRVATEIRLHDDSTRATIVEVTTRDRVGVLHAITQTFAELGLDISLAKVATEGEKVADVFYVTRGGDKLTDPAGGARRACPTPRGRAGDGVSVANDAAMRAEARGPKPEARPWRWPGPGQARGWGQVWLVSRPRAARLEHERGRPAAGHWPRRHTARHLPRAGAGAVAGVGRARRGHRPRRRDPGRWCRDIRTAITPARRWCCRYRSSRSPRSARRCAARPSR